jgi:hypothetical protein
MPRTPVPAAGSELRGRDHSPPPDLDRLAVAEAEPRAAGPPGPGLPAQRRGVRQPRGRVRGGYGHCLAVRGGDGRPGRRGPALLLRQAQEARHGPPGWSPSPTRATRGARTRRSRTRGRTSRIPRNRPTRRTRSSAHPVKGRTPSSRPGDPHQTPLLPLARRSARQGHPRTAAPRSITRMEKGQWSAPDRPNGG